MNVDAVVAVMSQIMQKNNYGEITKATSAGSGFLISSDGYVITNYHVIEGGSKITVITYDEKEHNATVVGYDKTNDVALLKIEGENFDCVTIGSSDELQVGDQVMAIGNPLGELTSTLTVGYVSAKDRMVTTDGSTINMLQTDAAINSGNSGGPLFNAKGEVVGINTAKYSGTSSSGATIEGIGFAIPIDDVAGIIGDLQDKGYVSSTYLGVYVSEVDATAQQNYGIPAGASVLEVTPGYCAEKAGIQAKDIIIAVGEYKVDSLSALSRALRRFEPGDTTTVTVWRAGVELKLEITLDEKPQQIPESSQPQDQEQEQQPSQEPPAQEEEDGFSFEDFLDRFFGFG
jgi:serine protease Do